MKKFMYHSIKRSLYLLYQRKNFEELIEGSSRGRKYHDNYTGDPEKKKMYSFVDGSLADSLLSCDGKTPFMHFKRSVTLNLNIDWWKMSITSNGSTGGIYCQIMNLNNDDRVTKELSILCGLIAGETEPSYICKYALYLETFS